MILKVVVDISNDSVDRTFDYLSDIDVPAGARVLVPFGNRTTTAVVTECAKTTTIDVSKLKNIIRVVDSSPIVSEEFLLLTQFMCDKFFLRKNDVFKLMVPASVRNDTARQAVQIMISIDAKVDLDDALKLVKRSSKQSELVAHMYRVGEVSLSELSSTFGRAVVDGAVKNGALLRALIQKTMISLEQKTDIKISLNIEQVNAVKTILAAPGTYLLHGITGSGKTEVYLNIIDHAISEGKTAIMLVPEISLTPMMLSRFAQRYGDNVAVLHSRLTPAEKYEQWKKLQCGQTKIVLGARSAIFSPVNNVGVIILDEEHDPSYTSENNPRYETLSVARWRAEYNKCPLILGSATPNITTYAKTLKGDIKLISLKSRALGTSMPRIDIVDMTHETLDGNTSCLSRELLHALKECIISGKQAMLFVNRRGFASFMMCRECGYVAKCTDCEVALVYHKDDEQLKCHYCGKKYKALTMCPSCKSKYIRYGATGTQRVVEELKEIFTDVKVLRMDNDTTRSRDGHKKILDEFGSTFPCILVGTQMIVKGHDFEAVSLVGIIDADVSLYNNDYRASETTFQLVTQVAGRAGRKSNDGRVILQTYAPKHYVYRLAKVYDYNKFFDHELNIRQATLFPPYSVLMRVLITSENEEDAKNTTKMIYERLLDVRSEYTKQIYALQAMVAPIKRIEKKYRYQIILRYAKNDDITCKIYHQCDIIVRNASIFIEADPRNIR